MALYTDTVMVHGTEVRGQTEKETVRGNFS